ncbi:MAG: P1 family peptidase [Burkholderiales bacterium]|jgi:L-aminopeptidase/D-esterase-like protein|nr:P1 family peptidase [Burkholderiales bacterium]
MSITAVPGLRVGHFTDPRRPTGCSVVLAPPGTVGGVDVRGAAPGTRETELLSPLNAVQQVHAVLLAGGSAYGLDAAGGVMRWLEEQGIGIQVGRDSGGTQVRVPIVPAAILFDLNVGDARIRPDAQAGYAACQAAAATTPAQGNVGAGAGASVGKLFGFDRAMRGGIGGAAIQVDGVTVGALIAVNAMGDVVDPGTGHVIAGARSADGTSLLDTMAALRRGELPPALQAGLATTIGVIGTDAKLDKAGANKLAQMAHDGLARAINPVHTQADGDTLFALATGGSGRGISLTLLGALAAEVTALAVLRAVRAATSLDAAGLPRLPAACDFGTLRSRTPGG